MVKSTPCKSSDQKSSTIRFSGRKKVRVLVIDDDEADFYSVSRLLLKSKNHAVSIKHARSFNDGLVQLNIAEFDVVLLDYFIGDDTARDFFDALNGVLPAPIIVFTGSGVGSLEDDMLEAGAFDFLEKDELTTETLALSIDFAIRRFAIEEKILAKNERMRRLCQNAETALSSKSEFLAYLGNEIQTPLNAILGFSKVMREMKPSMEIVESYRGYSGTIHDSATHLQNLIQDLLDLSETDADDFDVRHQRFIRYRTWIVDQKASRNGEDTGQVRAANSG